MSAAVVASRSITGHSVAGVDRIAFTRSISREIASDDGGVAPGLGVGAPDVACLEDDAESAARFAPQLPQNVAPSAIVVPHFGQFIARAPSVESFFFFAAIFCAERGRAYQR